MTVAVSATGTAAYKTSATTQNFTFSVNSGDSLLVAWVAQDATQSITSVTWDSGGTNQAMTLIGSKSCTTASNGAIYLYGLINPTSGVSKTLKVVQGTATGTGACVQTYTGTDTTSVATACTNVLTGAGGSSGLAGAGAQTGTSGDMLISGYVSNGSVSSQTNTSVFLLSPAGNDSSGNRAQATGSAITLSDNITGSWAAVSCDITQGSGSSVSGSLAATDGTDTAAFNGDVVDSGTLATTDTTDTAAFNGDVVVSGPLSTTDGTDTAAFNGFVGESGTLAATDTTDTAAFNGFVGESGTLAATDTNDTAAFTGDVVVSGPLATTDGTDTAAFNGTVGNVDSGTLAATDTPDTAAFNGGVIVSGPLATTDGTDTAAFAGDVVVAGPLVTTDGTDIAAFVGSVTTQITGTLATTEAPDIADFEQFSDQGQTILSDHKSGPPSGFGLSRKRWLELLNEFYGPDIKPSKAKKAVQAVKLAERLAEEARQERLINEANARHVAKLVAGAQQAAKMVEALQRADDVKRQIEKLRDDDDEDDILAMAMALL